MKYYPRWIVFVLAALLFSACKPADKLWPSDKIGQMPTAFDFYLPRRTLSQCFLGSILNSLALFP